MMYGAPSEKYCMEQNGWWPIPKAFKCEGNRVGSTVESVYSFIDFPTFMKKGFIDNIEKNKWSFGLRGRHLAWTIVSCPCSWFQLPVNVHGGSQWCSLSWEFATHMGDSPGIPAIWLQPDPALAAGIWAEWSRGCSSLSLSQSLSLSEKNFTK